jgi:hypothetical protein
MENGDIPLGNWTIFRWITADCYYSLVIPPPELGVLPLGIYGISFDLATVKMTGAQPDGWNLKSTGKQHADMAYHRTI